MLTIQGIAAIELSLKAREIEIFRNSSQCRLSNAASDQES